MLLYKLCSSAFGMRSSKPMPLFLIALIVLLVTMRVMAGYMAQGQITVYYPNGDLGEWYYTSVVQQAKSTSVSDQHVVVSDDKEGTYLIGDTELRIYCVKKDITKLFNWPDSHDSHEYSATNVSVRSLFSDEKILGYEVTKYEVRVDGELKEEYWKSAELGKRLETEIDYLTARRLCEAAARGTWRENVDYVNMSQDGGFSLKSIFYDVPGALKSFNLVTKIEIGDFPESTFEFPECFEEVDEDEMAKRLGSRDEVVSSNGLVTKRFTRDRSVRHQPDELSSVGESGRCDSVADGQIPTNGAHLTQQTGKSVEVEKCPVLDGNPGDVEDARSRCNLALAYASGVFGWEHQTKAEEWYRKAADQGDARGQFGLGQCYASGIGVPKNASKAVELYRKAANQGHARAQLNLGLCYESGTGVQKNESKAVEWYRKAADQGDAWGQLHLGLCYELGTGVVKNEAKAEEWCRKSADQGIEEATEALARLHEGQKDSNVKD